VKEGRAVQPKCCHSHYWRGRAGSEGGVVRCHRGFEWDVRGTLMGVVPFEILPGSCGVLVACGVLRRTVVLRLCKGLQGQKGDSGQSRGLLKMFLVNVGAAGHSLNKVGGSSVTRYLGNAMYLDSVTNGVLEGVDIPGIMATVQYATHHMLVAHEPACCGVCSSRGIGWTLHQQLLGGAALTFAAVRLTTRLRPAGMGCSVAADDSGMWCIHPYGCTL
jgi:hypothetical protein